MASFISHDTKRSLITILFNITSIELCEGSRYNSLQVKIQYINKLN